MSDEPDGAPPARLIDLEPGRQPRAIAAWIIDDKVLIDPGPATTVTQLLAALEGWQPSAIALTHIHLDHAGATGHLLRCWPDTDVYVHVRGAAHLADPDRLVASARRVYASDLESLFGIPIAVPGDAIRPLRGGEIVAGLDVLYTPGHAPHHVTYLHRASGWAFVGDLAGVRIPPADLVLMPTVPPSTDLAAWGASLERLRARHPPVLALTHFGVHRDVDKHLALAQEGLTRWSDHARHLDYQSFTEAVLTTISGASSDDVTTAAYRLAAQPIAMSTGLDHLWQAAGDQ
jgi:glyoxylase-like metal-dependent hydrolase (beta-lactamase superfamily II)